MKIFLDTADVEEIKYVQQMGFLDGVTTNPTLVAKVAKGGKNYEQIIAEVCSACPGPVSVEALSLKPEEMLLEARRLSKIAKNVVIKIPITQEGISITRILTSEGIRVNQTLIFSGVQALLAAKAGATYVSPFIGRLDDIGHTGMDIVSEIKTIFRNYGYQTQIIVASIRHPQHVLAAAKLGADIATMPYEVFKKLFKHSLTDQGIQRFLEDYKRAFGSF
jgi:transaldolase